MTLDELYDRLPTVACQRKCGQSCGPLAVLTDEHAAMVRWIGRPLAVNAAMTCTYLDVVNVACQVHPVRPLLCRLWGCVDDPLMRCPHGCQPSRWLSNEEFRGLMHEIEADQARGVLGPFIGGAVIP